MDIELSPNYLLSAEEAEAKGKENYKVGRVALKKGEDMMVNMKDTQHEYQPVYQCFIPWQDPADHHPQPSSPPVAFYLKFTNPVIPSLACPSLTVTDESNRVISILPIENIPPGGITELKVHPEQSVRVDFGETELKRQPKAIKINDKTFFKTEIQGRINVVNTRLEAVSVRIIRGLKGNVLDAGGGSPDQIDLTQSGSLSFQVTLLPSKSREIIYKYEALVPAGE